MLPAALPEDEMHDAIAASVARGDIRSEVRIAVSCAGFCPVRYVKAGHVSADEIAGWEYRPLTDAYLRVST